MDARNRMIEVWFHRVRTGQIKLPRFQRYEAWGPNEVKGLLETVIRGLPAGATLTLAIGNDEPFRSRYLATAPEGGERVAEHLLDGQQRLTALWRSLHDNYADRTYFVREVLDEDSGESIPEVLSQARWERNGTRYPVWCDDPAAVWSRGYIPVRLLNPEDSGSVRSWAQAAAHNDGAVSWDIAEKVNALRTKVAQYNIPFLELPVTTPKDVALDVFIKMNTSSVRLTAYDIVVAQLEEATGQSLHELVDDLRAAVPSLSRFGDLGSLALDVAALRADRSPSQASYQKLDMEEVFEDWPDLVAGVRWAADLLEDERVFDKHRLPTTVALPVLAALHAHVPAALDGAGNGRILATAYLWRSFVTRRYEQAASTRALQDFRGLRDAVLADKPLTEVSAPIFDESLTPLPTADDLRKAGWPKTRDVLARGILAVALRMDGLDIADGKPARADTLPQREYHHLFPESLLTKVAGLHEERAYRALNCALITWSTNRNISNKSPLNYLAERVARNRLGEAEVRHRLRTHLVPYEALAEAGPYDSGPEDAGRIERDYESFLDQRARMMLPVVHALCRGERLEVG